MQLRQMALAAVMLTALWPASTRAGADDYTFEAVNADVNKGDATVAVRLIQKSTGKPVVDAVIARVRIDMGPDGMPTMDAPIAEQPKGEPGVYAFKANLPMAGHWQLSVAAKVQGEPETVVGGTTFTVK